MGQLARGRAFTPGRGFGRTLMDEAERRLSRLGCPKVNLQIRAENKEAIAFYERVGFAADSVVSMGSGYGRIET